MNANRDRARAAARIRLEREMALRAEQAQKRRRIQLISAGAGTLVVILGMVWLIVAVSSDGKKKPSASASSTAEAAPAACSWKPKTDPSAAPQPLPPEVKDIGTPPASGEPRSGTETITITTNLGVIKASVDTAKAPCTAANFTYLAGKKFLDNTECHRMTTASIYVLQCGDPSATGRGGPAYQYADENLPTNRRPAYPEGTIAMANAGAGTNGSQFFIVYKDTELQPQYTVLGKVTEGLDLVKKVAEAGVDATDPQSPGDGKPKTPVKILTFTVSPPQA